jgi:hypothetical protein
MNRARPIATFLLIIFIVSLNSYASDKSISFEKGIKIVLKGDSTVIKGKLREIKPTGIAVYSKKEGSRFYFKDQIDQVYYRKSPSWGKGMLFGFIGLLVGGVVGYAIDSMGDDEPERDPFAPSKVQPDETNTGLIIGCAIAGGLVFGGFGSSIGEYKKVDTENLFENYNKILGFGFQYNNQTIYLTVQMEL